MRLWNSLLQRGREVAYEGQWIVKGSLNSWLWHLWLLVTWGLCPENIHSRGCLVSLLNVWMEDAILIPVLLSCSEMVFYTWFYCKNISLWLTFKMKISLKYYILSLRPRVSFSKCVTILHTFKNGVMLYTLGCLSERTSLMVRGWIPQLKGDVFSKDKGKQE